MKRKEKAALARAHYYLRDMGIRVLGDCKTGIYHLHDMYGGGLFARYTLADMLAFCRLD